LRSGHDKATPVVWGVAEGRPEVILPSISRIRYRAKTKENTGGLGGWWGGGWGGNINDNQRCSETSVRKATKEAWAKRGGGGGGGGGRAWGGGGGGGGGGGSERCKTAVAQKEKLQKGGRGIGKWE